MSVNTFNEKFNESAEFKSSLKWSLIFHVAIFVLFTIKATFFQEEAIDYSAAVRVDIVALPEKLDPNQISQVKPEEKSEKTKAEPLPDKKEKTKDPEAINLKKT